MFYELMRRRGPLCFYAFDLLWLDGSDLRERLRLPKIRSASESTGSPPLLRILSIARLSNCLMFGLNVRLSPCKMLICMARSFWLRTGFALQSVCDSSCCLRLMKKGMTVKNAGQGSSPPLIQDSSSHANALHTISFAWKARIVNGRVNQLCEILPDPASRGMGFAAPR